jgi:hypothetical protein
MLSFLIRFSRRQVLRRTLAGAVAGNWQIIMDGTKAQRDMPAGMGLSAAVRL